ncbi:MAG: hypothetical protein AB4372_03390 [Xenococcus sp. (in: cyanobacteria)]
MSGQQKQEAFDAIYDEALKLLNLDISEEVKKGLQQIISLARYQHDTRPSQARNS